MKNKIIDRIKEMEIELAKIKYANNPNKLQSELKELNKNERKFKMDEKLKLLFKKN